jgi:hypothetical protein
MTASTGTRTVAARLTKWLMLRELRLVNPKGVSPIRWGMRIQEDDCRPCRGRRWGTLRRTCVMVIPGKRKWVVSDEGMAGGKCCGLEQGLAITHQLVRESGGEGVSVSESIPATLAFVRAVFWCACWWVCADGIAGPLVSRSALDFWPRRMSPGGTPIESGAGIESIAEPVIFAGESSALGGESSARRTGMWP